MPLCYILTDDLVFFGRIITPGIIPTPAREWIHVLFVGCLALYPLVLTRLKEGAKYNYHGLSNALLIYFSFFYLNDFFIGWLVLGLHHNMQYLLISGKFNSTNGESFKGIQTILLAIVLSALVIWGLNQLKTINSLLPMTFLLGLSLNFTHYLVDGVIWKKPKSP